MFIASLILLQLMVFGGLIFIFRRIMSQNIVSATRHLEELSQDYRDKEREINAQLEETKKKSQDLMDDARQEAEKLKMQIIEQAEKESDSLVQQARTQAQGMIEQADKSRQLLLSEMEERVTKEAVDRACELIQDTLPEHFKQIVHTHWVEELFESGFSQLERLHIPEDTREVKIVSAFKLSDAERKNLSKKLKDLLGGETVITEEVDPKVVAGLIISIGSLVLDGSLKNRIQEKSRDAQGSSINP